MNLETHPVEVHKNPLTQEETNRMVELSQRISDLEEALLK